MRFREKNPEMHKGLKKHDFHPHTMFWSGTLSQIWAMSEPRRGHSSWISLARFLPLPPIQWINSDSFHVRGG